MKRVLSLILALVMAMSMLTFVVTADDAQSAASLGKAFVLPNTNTDIPAEGVQVWSGKVDFDESAKGVTFVLRFTGVNKPVVASKINPTFTLEDGSSWDWSKSADQWQWNNVWGGIFAPELVIPEDGTYYLYLNQKALSNNTEINIKSVTALNLFCSKGNNKGQAPVNLNKNATIEVLDIVPCDLQPEVNFYNGDELLTTQTMKYTDIGNKTAGDSKNEAKKDGVNDAWAKQFDKLINATDLFLTNEDGIELPSKPADENFYLLYWKDEDGNRVDGVYQSGNLYADYDVLDKSEVSVTFVDVDGKKILTETMKRDALVFNGVAPTKNSDSDYNYSFAGWSNTAGGAKIDLSTYHVPDDVAEITFYPVFDADLILKATLIGPDSLELGESADYQVAFNRDDMTTETGVEKIITGNITVTFNPAELTIEGQKVAEQEDGTAVATVSFSSTALSGAVLGEIKVTADGFVGSPKLTLTGEANGGEIAENIVTLPVTGQLPGLYIQNPEAVTIARADENTKPAKQALWSGNVSFDDSHAMSFVFKLDGIETPINAYELDIEYNGKRTGAENWFFTDCNNWSEAPSPRYQKFEKNGYYVLYLNNRLLNGDKINLIQKFNIFSTADYSESTEELVHETPTNTNDNATFTMLAVLGEALTPTVTFHGTDGQVIGESITHKYVDESTFNDKGYQMKQMVELLDPAAIFTLASEAETEEQDKVYVVPTKETDEYYSYEFDYWADADGNRVNAVYMNMDLYPVFKKTILSPVNVTFVIDGVESDPVEIPKGTAPTYEGTPTKDSTSDYSYLFAGWTTEKDHALATNHKDAEAWGQELSEIIAQEDITVYAVFEQVERIWEVNFYTEDKTVLLGNLRVRQGKLIDLTGAEAEPPTAPEKPATQQYSYTFAGWVDANGNSVDPTKVEKDMDLYASYTATLNKYTVTFMDEDRKTVRGSSTVDYGTAATAPTNPTKASDKYYSYTFDKWLNKDGTDADFSNVTEDVIVYASYTPAFINPYEDADLSRYYGKAVEYVTVNGIMNGVDATHFSPNGTATRGMIVTVLYRMEGSPDIEDMDNKFTDVPEGKYYTDAVIWASNVGVVNGTSDDKFSPNNNVTREQFATMIYRYADKIKGYYMSPGNATLGVFADKNDISTYATSAVKWAVASEKDMTGQGITYYNKTALIEGVRVDENTLNMNPKGNATRAQMATMLERFITGEHLDASKA